MSEVYNCLTGMGKQDVVERYIVQVLTQIDT